MASQKPPPASYIVVSALGSVPAVTRTVFPTAGWTQGQTAMDAIVGKSIHRAVALMVFASRVEASRDPSQAVVTWCYTSRVADAALGCETSR